MFKLYVVLVFNALAFGYVGAPETELPIQNDDDGTSQSHHPLILLVKNNKLGEIFNFATSDEDRQDRVRFNGIQILNQDLPSDQLRADERIFYLCGRDALTDCSFETRFGSEPRRCVREPIAIRTYQQLGEYLYGTGKYCKPDNNMKFGIFAIQLCIPDIDGYGEKMCNYERQKNNFITDDSQELKTWYKVKYLELYQFCYNDKEKRTEWTIREVKPSSLHSRKRAPNQESIFEIREGDTNMVANFQNQNFNEPYAVPHKLVPSEENSFKLWDIVTSNAKNRAPLWSHFEPLFDLIDERLQRLSNRLSRSIIVKTQPVYENFHKYYVNGNEGLPIAEIWIVHAYVKDMYAAVTVVVHNSKTLQKPPPPGALCEGDDDVVNCDFKKWKEISSRFHEILRDEVMQFAYCCITSIHGTKYRFKPQGLDINFDNNPDNHGETTIDGRW